MESITILGSTGSIGVSTLAVLALNREQYRIEALTAHKNVDLLYEQCLAFSPNVAVMVNEAAGQQLKERLAAAGCHTHVLIGSEALVNCAADHGSTTVVAALVGAVGLRPVVKAIQAGKKILLANKETLVMAGPLMIALAQQYDATLIPVDSEHNALLQCMPAGFVPGGVSPDGVSSIVLTASGGPFLDLPLEQLAQVTPQQALRHPNWEMGPKVTIDSASMMNKALEVIEARWLFGLPESRIEVVIHPQSIVHSMVRYQDGSVLAQMGLPDMRTPIAAALSWPNRINAGVASVDFVKQSQLTFQSVEQERFPCLQLAYAALAAGGCMPCALNAANEMAVAAFMAGKIGFTDIARVNQAALEQVEGVSELSLEAVYAADQEARRLSSAIIDQIAVES